MALLGYSFAFLALAVIVAWIVFPRLMRALAIAVFVFVVVALVVDAASEKTPPSQEQRR